jgi:hypothetical protein
MTFYRIYHRKIGEIYRSNFFRLLLRQNSKIPNLALKIGKRVLKKIPTFLQILTDFCTNL